MGGSPLGWCGFCLSLRHAQSARHLPPKTGEMRAIRESPLRVAIHSWVYEDLQGCSGYAQSPLQGLCITDKMLQSPAVLGSLKAATPTGGASLFDCSGFAGERPYKVAIHRWGMHIADYSATSTFSITPTYILW